MQIEINHALGAYAPQYIYQQIAYKRSRRRPVYAPSGYEQNAVKQEQVVAIISRGIYSHDG